LGGKYRLIRLLGQGGMGSVWHAQHLALNASVALKFIDAERLDGAALQRFLGEARVAAALRSAHVVQILDYGFEDQIPYFAMEMLEGETLAERLKRQKRLDIEQTGRVVQHVSRAISRAHDAGVIHRDLKPQNIFIVGNEEDEIVKVLDFGIAKSTRGLLGNSAAASTNTGALIGTPHYMSPEQVEGDKSIDVRSDLWSLGVVVYQCLLGELPFAGDTIGSIALAICSRPLPVPSQRGAVPPGFDAWFETACARDPEARFRSARQASSEFMALCAGSNGRAAPAPIVASAEFALMNTSAAEAASATVLGTTTGRAATEAPARPAPRSRPKLQLVALLALLALLGAGAAVAFSGGGKADTPAIEMRASSGAPNPTGALEPAAGSSADVAAGSTQPSASAPVPSVAPPVEEPPAVTSTIIGTVSATTAAPLPARAPVNEVPRKVTPTVPAPTPTSARPASHESTVQAPPPVAPPPAPARIPAVPAENIDLGI
jgi:serine/threonine-protein kinase